MIVIVSTIASEDVLGHNGRAAALRLREGGARTAP
jgi:hypothetical protein